MTAHVVPEEGIMNRSVFNNVKSVKTETCLASTTLAQPSFNTKQSDAGFGRKVRTGISGQHGVMAARSICLLKVVNRHNTLGAGALEVCPLVVATCYIDKVREKRDSG